PDHSTDFSGDTTESPALIERAQGPDILVLEVPYEPALDWLLVLTTGSDLRLHLLNSHTTADRVGAVSHAANGNTLLLHHFVPTDADISHEQWHAEASRSFDGEVIVGSDLLTL